MVENFGEHIKYSKKTSDMSPNYKNDIVSII